jgi:hypothetical protein
MRTTLEMAFFSHVTYLVVLAPTLFVTILHGHEVATLNAEHSASDGQAFTFPLVWMWGGSGGTFMDYIQHIWLVLLATLAITALVVSTWDLPEQCPHSERT